MDILLQTFVQLPDPAQAAIFAAVTFVLGFIINQISIAVPWLASFLGQYKAEISMAVSGAIVTLVQNVLNTIPVQYDDIVSLVIQLVLAVLAALGLFNFLAKKNVKGFTAG